jgi:hypothetical protein
MLSYPIYLIAEYKVQHYLKVESERGEVTASGWYNEGSQVEINVKSTIDYGNGTRHCFVGWAGDITSSSERSFVMMDKPKEIRAIWKKQYSLSTTSAGLPEGASVQLEINGAKVTETVPFVHSSWVEAGSSVEFTALSVNVTFSSRSYIFDKWLRQDVSIGGSPIRIHEPISLTAKYRPSVRSYIHLVAQPSLFGDSVSLSGRLTPSPASARLEIWYSRNESSWSRISEVSVLSDGTFFSNWKPNLSGTMFLKASWKGDDEYAGSESPRVMLKLSTSSDWQNMMTLPGIVQWVSTLEAANPSARILLLPLRPIIMLSMDIFKSTHLQPWISEISAYVIASSIIGVTYLTLPILLVVVAARKVNKRTPSLRKLKPLVAQLFVGLTLLTVSQILGITLLALIGLGILAVSVLVMLPGALALSIARSALGKG